MKGKTPARKSTEIEWDAMNTMENKYVLWVMNDWRGRLEGVGGGKLNGNSNTIHVNSRAGLNNSDKYVNIDSYR